MNRVMTLAAVLFLSAAEFGCVGYVEGPGDGGGVIVAAPAPEFGFWGGGYGRDEYRYGDRGHFSRGGRR
jgi:hypothetical protein